MSGNRWILKCKALHRIEIPSSVEVIKKSGFFLCPSLRVVIIDAGCRMRISEAFRAIRLFLVSEDEDMKESRSLAHLDVGGRRKARRRLF
jgi:hypothetical protein